MNRASSFNFGIEYVSETGHVVQPHRHECYEIVYYSSCYGTTEIGGKQYDFSGGALALISPGTVHSEYHRGGGRILYIGFDTEISGLPEQGIFLLKEDHIPRLMRTILSELKMQKFHYDAMIASKLNEICILLSRESVDLTSGPKDILHVKNYIEENYSGKINLQLLADSCGYSSSYLRYKFKLLYGEAPQNYLMNVRLAQAYALLREGIYNCTEVCYRCGFSNCSQFTKMFKKKYGILPGRVKSKK